MTIKKYRTLLWLPFLLSVLLTLPGCSYGDDIDALRERVDALEDAVAQLDRAYRDGKIISSVDAVGGTPGGWKVTFSDNTSLTIVNGKDGADGSDGVDGAPGADGRPGTDGRDGITPMMQIDEEGFWSVSYDGGTTYIRLLTDSGQPVKAQGPKGDTGADGADGKPGAVGPQGPQGPAGTDGRDGLCVRVAKDAEGFFIFEVYDPADPSVALETIPTYWPSRPGDILQSVVKDQSNGTIVITMADGTRFPFNLDVCYPTGIVILTDNLQVNAGGHSEFRFRVNPSNANVAFVTDGDDVNLELDVVGGALTRSSYVTPPTHYRLTGVEKDRDAQGQILEGQYVARAELVGDDHSFADNVCLVYTTHDGNGRRIQLTSSIMRVSYGDGSTISGISLGDTNAVATGDDTFELEVPYGLDLQRVPLHISTDAYRLQCGATSPVAGPDVVADLTRPLAIKAISRGGIVKEYTLYAHHAEVPVLYLETSIWIASKNWVKNIEGELINAGPYNARFHKMQVKGRGNTTWNYPKKPYAIKLDAKSGVLGMKANKRWVLLANYIDQTNMRNDAAFEIGRRMSGLDWTPSGEFVELVINGEWLGLYYLCEQIRVGSGRVDITEMEPGDTQGESLTGGYLLEFDTNYDEVNKFHTVLNFPCMIKEPDEDVLSAPQLKYITDYVNGTESLLIGGIYSWLTEQIDVESFADYWLVQTLTGNLEIHHPKSLYMHKNRGGLLKAGPIWDFDYGTFLKPATGWQLREAFWYSRLFDNPEFAALVKQRWRLHRDALATLPEYIARRASAIRAVSVANKEQWMLDGSNDINGTQQMSYDASVEALISYYETTFAWIDSHIAGL